MWHWHCGALCACLSTHTTNAIESRSPLFIYRWRGVRDAPYGASPLFFAHPTPTGSPLTLSARWRRFPFALAELILPTKKGQNRARKTEKKRALSPPPLSPPLDSAFFLTAYPAQPPHSTPCVNVIVTRAAQIVKGNTQIALPLTRSPLAPLDTIASPRSECKQPQKAFCVL